ncbi:MAG: glycosyltransferase family 4 protein [Chloroflexi bacterium]|nr:glycosyltransferase family 4 protein [Chloroflexota bacterium]
MSLRLCRLATIPFTFITLLPAQLRIIIDSGIDLTLVSSSGDDLDLIMRDLLVRGAAIPMARQPSPLQDLRSLIILTKFFRREKFDIVHSSTLKAGLLTALAGWFANIPIRIHTYTGQIWVEMEGPMRFLMRGIDCLIGALNTHTYADSFSQRELLIREKIIAPNKIGVIANGSLSGVDFKRFDPKRLAPFRADIRRQLGVADSAVVIVFVGRVTRDKGVVELIDAFENLRHSYHDLHLILVGPFEVERDPLPPRTIQMLSGGVNIHSVGFTPQPELYLASADIFCLPSYREGFGSAAIEAGAMNLPVVATTVTGLVDAIVDGETGLLVPPKNVEALTHALDALAASPEMRQRMGRAARTRAIDLFDANTVNRAVVNEYFKLTQHL